MSVIGSDLAARRVIAAAYAYYVLDRPIMDDARYDRLAGFVADNWAELALERQWALGSPEELRASGHHIRFSSAAVYAAEARFRELFREEPPVTPALWRVWEEAPGAWRYVTAADVWTSESPERIT